MALFINMENQFWLNKYYLFFILDIFFYELYLFILIFLKLYIIFRANFVWRIWNFIILKCRDLHKMLYILFITIFRKYITINFKILCILLNLIYIFNIILLLIYFEWKILNLLFNILIFFSVLSQLFIFHFYFSL